MRKTAIYKPGMIGILTAILLTGCVKDNDQELKDQETRLLQQYLATNKITEEPTQSGIYYLPITEGTGVAPNLYTWVEIQYTGELLDGTVFTTSDEETAKANDILDEEFLYGPARLQVGYIGIAGLNEGIQLMKVGGKARFIIPSELAMGGYATGGVPAYSTLIYTVELLEAFDDPEKHEQEKIWAYMKENAFENVDSTDSGLYYVVEQSTDEALFAVNDKVNVWYTGKFLDGRVFDSNVGGEVYSFTVPGPYNIQGWQEGIQLMRNNEKGIFIIPYYLGYGADGRYDNFGRVKIPPYMTLVFEMDAALSE